MVRFFVTPEALNDKEIILTGENANHAKVLRLKDGDKVVLCDGEGREAVCNVTLMGASYCLIPECVDASRSEAKVKAGIYMALPKADKLEHVIQKATELGAYEIVTFPTERCVSRPDEKSLNKKLERWRKIAVSAAEQCGRGRIPKIIALSSYKEALARAGMADMAIVFYENERSHTLHDALSERSFESISLLTGPEGGLEENEIRLAEEAGVEVCTLGSRILRCETAPLCALSAVMYHCGEF